MKSVNKMHEAIERKCFAEIAVIAWDKIWKDNRLSLNMIDDYLQYGKLSDKTIEQIKECFK